MLELSARSVLSDSRGGVADELPSVRGAHALDGRRGVRGVNVRGVRARSLRCSGIDRVRLVVPSGAAARASERHVPGTVRAVRSGDVSGVARGL